jgi:hypothetical protein
MYKPYKKPVYKASPNLKVNEPHVSKFVVFLIKVFGRLYLFLFWGIARVVLRGDKIVFDAFKRALSGESRCIIAIRHPNGGEPQLLTWFFLFRLRSLAARKGIRFERWPHAVFVYGYEVVRWGGWVARFIMPNLGCMPIHHSKIDKAGMERIYRAIIEGPYPVSLAPEGGVSFTTDSIPRLESGIIRIGFSAAEQLAKKNKNCPVVILPISIHFRFGNWGSMTMEILLRKIEKVCGLFRKDSGKFSFTERVKMCRDHILEVNESRFRIKNDASLSFNERLDKIIEASLETAERIMSLKNEGDFFYRINRLRQIYWDQIYLPGVESLEGMTCIERSVLDLRAGEAWYAGRYQELADLCWFFRIPIPEEDAAIHSKIEFVQNLWDFANRTMGGAFFNRVSIFPRKVLIQAAPVINLSERLPYYKENKKDAIAKGLSDLEKAFHDCIDEVNKTERNYGKFKHEVL